MEGDFGAILEQMAYDLEKYDCTSRDLDPFVIDEETALRIFSPNRITTVVYNQSLKMVRCSDPNWDPVGILWHIGLTIPKIRILRRHYLKPKVLFIRDNESDMVYKLHICS